MRWLFPGYTIRIDAPCLDCGEAMVVEMTDAGFSTVEPTTMIGYTSAPVGGDAATRPFR